MRVALDTNAYTLLSKGDEKMADVIRSSEEIFLPFMVLAELRAGFRAGAKVLENEKTLIQFLNRHRVGVLYPDEQSTHHYAALYFQLRRQGTPIPTIDLWIATMVIQYDMVLCSRDKHFDALPQIPRV